MAPPSSQTRDYGALLTTTLQAMQPRIHDNVSRGSVFLRLLNDRGVWRTQNGGDQVKVGLMHAQNNTADIYSGYGLLDTTPQEGITSAFFDWAQLSVSITISRKEERQNAGQSRIISLLETKIRQAEVSLQELLNNCIVAGRITASADEGQFFARIGRLDSGALGPLPLAAIIDADADRSVTLGNINGLTHAFWRNQSTESTAATFAALKKELTTVYNNCTKGAGAPPNPTMMLSDQALWETYWASLASQERYVVDDQRTLDVLAGSDALKFRGATWAWDEVVPDVETNAEVVDGIGTSTLSNIWFLNLATLEFITDAETDFITTPFIRPQDQDARVAQILWMGQVGVNNRRKNGVLYGVSRSITA